MLPSAAAIQRGFLMPVTRTVSAPEGSSRRMRPAPSSAMSRRPSASRASPAGRSSLLRAMLSAPTAETR
ncbi:MAG: hypothetical protein AUF63_00660 [Candidatus Rokubacteria bacterium 13_1_20CM_70_15]|nr:MAG: hypothetical protein AUF63_00660 [Candidatus Rokubacteria bacterium 13_1_20CM_70_15]